MVLLCLSEILDCTFFTKKEIIKLHQRFRELNPDAKSSKLFPFTAEVRPPNSETRIKTEVALWLDNTLGFNIWLSKRLKLRAPSSQHQFENPAQYSIVRIKVKLISCEHAKAPKHVCKSANRCTFNRLGLPESLIHSHLSLRFTFMKY